MDRYKKLCVLGAGSFGKVYKVLNKDDGLEYVLKRIALSNSEDAKLKAFEEVDVLEDISHPFIVGIIEHFWDDEEQDLCVVMTYCQKGDLYTFIQKQWETNQLVPEATVWRFLVQMLSALAYLHSEMKIMHRDLKTQNIFLLEREDGKLCAMIGDFGLAKKLEETFAMAKTPLGTPFYMAPEIMSGNAYNYKSDMWALGCIGYELCTRDPAFGASTFPGVANKVLRGEYDPMPACYSQDLQKVIKCLLAQKPNDRPMAKELLYSDVFARHREEYNAEWEGRGQAYTLSAGAKLKPLKVSYEELPDPRRKSGLLAPLPATPSSTPIAGTSDEPKPKKKKPKKKLDVHSKLERAGSLDLHKGNLRDLLKSVEEIVSEEPNVDSKPEEVPEPEESYEDDFEDYEYDDDFESDTDEVPQGMQSEVIKDLRRGRVSQLRSNCIDALGSGLYEKFYNFSRQKNGMQESGNFEDEQAALQAMKSDLVAVVGDKWGDYWCMLDEIIFYEDTAWRFQ